MAKTVKDTYGEILKLRNEFYQKWQDAPQYDENRDAYRAKYEAFDKALELLTPSIVDPQPEDSGKLTLSVTKMSDQEETVSDDLEAEIQRYKDSHDYMSEYIRDVARHFANWQREHDTKYKADNNICCMNFDDIEAARIGAYEQGKSDMKQQMMKDAISAKVTEIYYPTDSCLEIEATLPEDRFEDGDKVLIIKED